MNTAIIRVSLFALLAIFFSDILYSYHKYQSVIFDMDSYIFYESAKQLYSNNIARIGFWPNSSTGLDIVTWGHYLPAYYYLTMAVFESGPNAIYLYQILEKIIILASVFFIIKKYIKSKKMAVILLCLVLLDPLYSWFVLSKQYTRWPLIFGYLSILLILKIYKDKDHSLHRSAYNFLASLFLVMTVGSHASIGLPIAAGIAVFIITELINHKTSGLKALYMFLGLTAGSALVLLPIIYNFSVDEISNLYSLLLSYLYNISVGDNLYSSLLQRGFFVSNIFIPIQALSILGIAPMLIFLSVKNYKAFNDEEKVLIRLFTIVFLVSVVFGMLSPVHFTGVRMVWMMPLIIVLLFIVARRLNSMLIIYITVSTLIASFAYQLTKNYLSVYMLALFVVFLMTSFAALYLFAKKKIGSNLKVLQTSLFMLMLTLTSGLLGQKISAIEFDNFNQTPSYDLLKKSVLFDIRQSSRLGDLNPDDWILTNYPISDFYKNNGNIQIIRNHRPLMQGVRDSACNYIYLIGKEEGDLVTIDTSEVLTINFNKINYLYYRGYIYGNLSKTKLLDGNHVSIVGDPVNALNMSIKPHEIVSLDKIEKEDVLGYIQFRKDNDFKMR